jgi:dihydrolipoamide dehydrogenase
MDRYDLIVIGSGAGLNVIFAAVEHGLKVALVEQGPLGGTCLNNGCIPSKMLIYPADVLRSAQNARILGLEVSVDRVDFRKIMSRMHSFVEQNRQSLEEAVAGNPSVTLYRSRAEFIGEYALRTGDRTLTAPQIVIASGARPLVPAIPGLKEAGYLDNISLLDLEEPPQSLIVIGAGYIGCEYGHFFSAMGTEVTLLGRSPSVLSDEEPEVSQIVEKVLARQMRVITNHEVVGIEREGGEKVVSARNRLDNKVYTFEAQEILLAVGRRSNADILKPEMTGVQTDEHGWIKVDEFLQTTKKDIWALGDAIGKHMFRHTANYEAQVVFHNLLHAERRDERIKADFHAVPNAVFSNPQVGAVGMKESEALAAGRRILVGRAKYTDVAKGVAMAEENGFVKVIIEEEGGKILGCSIAGSMAPELVQQVVYLMNAERQDLEPLIGSQVIHPSLSEVIVKAFSNLEHPYHAAEE